MRRNNEVERIKHEGLVAIIEYSEDTYDPRKDCEQLAVFYCWHRRYKLGDQQPEERGRDWLLWLAQSFVKNLNPDHINDENLNKLLEKHCVMMPLYLYDHSGITMSCGPFGCSWDSGQVGWAVISRKAAFDNWSATAWDQMVPSAIWDEKEKKAIKGELSVRDYSKRLIEAEVKEYAQFLEGEVYDYRIEDAEGCELGEGERGLFGFDYAREEALAAVKAMAEELVEKGAHVSI